MTFGAKTDLLSKMVPSVGGEERRWGRFVRCMEALPPDQALPLWQIVHHQSTHWASEAVRNSG